MKPIEKCLNENLEWVVVTDKNLLWVYEHSVRQMGLQDFIEKYQSIKASGGFHHILVRKD